MTAAMSSFRSLGFKACTIEEIADRAGVFKGSFYNHFKSKEALAVAAVELYLAEGLKTLPLEGPPSAVQRLRTHFETPDRLRNLMCGTAVFSRISALRFLITILSFDPHWSPGSTNGAKRLRQ